MRVLAGLGVVALLVAALGYYWLAVRPAERPVAAGSAPPAPAAAAPERSAGGTAPAPEPRASPDASPDPARAAPSRAPSASTDESARVFVGTLTGAAGETLSATAADHFVSGAQVIGLEAERVVEELTLRELQRRPDLGPDTPITIIKEVPQIDLASPEQLIADAGGDLEREVRVMVDDRVETLSVREVLARHAGAADQPISVVKVIDYLQPTTLSEIMRSTDSATEWDDMIRIIKGPHRPETASVADLLAGIEGVTEDSVFYVHSVRESDRQGVWGIIHDGLIDNFARGMAIRRGEELDTFRVDIPRDADERRQDNSSSFLGKLIDEKTRSSAVYNFRAGHMTRNPDLIVPGSEIVIVNFSPDELVDIYRHFLQTQAHAT